MMHTRALFMLVTTVACGATESRIAPLPQEQASVALSTVPSDAGASAPAEATEATADGDAFEKARLERDRGEKAQARATLIELLKRWPASTYVPDAWVALGDMSFELGESGDDAQMKEAEREYQEAVRSPPPANHAYGYAWYKLAYVYWNSGDGARALNAFKKTVDYGSAYPQNPGAAKLRVEALRDIVPVYALVGKPSVAYAFFRSASGDDDKSIDMLSALASTYSDTGKYAEAQLVYRDLIVRDPVHSCAYGVRSRFTAVGMTRAAEDQQLKKCP